MEFSPGNVDFEDSQCSDTNNGFKAKLKTFKTFATLPHLSVFSETSGTIHSYQCNDAVNASKFIKDVGQCIEDLEDSTSTSISCQIPQQTECSNQYWIVGMCCGGVGIVVNPKERGSSFCGCSDSSSSGSCQSVIGTDFARGRMISILPCMTRDYCSTNWGGYGGQCKPTTTHTLSLTYTSK